MTRVLSGTLCRCAGSTHGLVRAGTGRGIDRCEGACPRDAGVPAAAPRADQALGLAARAAPGPGERPERAPRRVLARHQAERLDRRQGRGLGARPVLARRDRPARLPARRPALKAKVKRFVDYILDHQQPDGWLGPIGDTAGHKPYDLWPLFPLFKALTQYQEATGDPRVVPALAEVLPEDRPGHRPDAPV